MKKRNSGQAIVFVLLIMLLGLTVGLSTTSRTLQDLKQTTVSDQSSRAFSLAEAGIEAGLATSDLSPGDKTIQINGVDVKYNIQSGVTTKYETKDAILENEIAQLNFKTGLVANTSVSVYWTKISENGSCDLTETSGSVPAAVEISVYYLSGTTYDVKKYAYDAGSCDIPTNGFTVAGSGAPDYRSMVLINIPQSSRAILRIRPIYNKAYIMVTGTNLPTDDYTITAQATAGNATRALQVVKTGSSLPPTFDYTLFSAAGL